MSPPVSEEPARTASRTLCAPPPVSPLVERRSGAQPGSMHSSITWSLPRICPYSSSAEISMAAACWTRTASDMGQPASSAAATTPARVA